MAGKTKRGQVKREGKVKRKPGPPRKLDAKLSADLCERLERGDFAAWAAAALDVGARTMDEWMALGEKPDAPAEFRALAHARRKGQAAVMARAEGLGDDGNAAGVKVQLWKLERLDRVAFSGRTEVAGPGGGALQIAGLADLLGHAHGGADDDEGDG